jgi:hypothetical protein
MTTNITITKTSGGESGRAFSRGFSREFSHTPGVDASPSTRRKIPGWLWFIALWCFGVASAVSLGFVFKLLMNATLFAVK